MQILLISPSSGKWRRVGRAPLVNGKTFRFSMLSLLSVAAETPEWADVRLIDEQIDDIPWGERPDLVGVTCMTALAPRAYAIADRFRAAGVPVVLGGMHPTFCSEEALTHADAVVAGEAEGVWSRVVEDARDGRLHGVYRSEVPADLARLRRPPRHLLSTAHYANLQAVQATRGCPHRCAFCSVAAFHSSRFRTRPLEEVLGEVKAIPGRFVLFVDDNLTADRDYALALCRGLEDAGKLWITQSSLAVARDPEWVRALARAGCIGLFVGLETVGAGNLEGVDKTCHRIEEYEDAVGLLHRHGIGVEAGLVFGFDGDDAGVFSRTLDFVERLEIDAVQVSIFTPLPGTPSFVSMKDRIIDRNWEHYDFHHAVIRPRGMNAEELQAGHDWVTREFYRPWRIARRLARIARRPGGVRLLPYAASLNLAYLGRIRSWGIRGWNPEANARRGRGALTARPAGCAPAPTA